MLRIIALPLTYQGGKKDIADRAFMSMASVVGMYSSKGTNIVEQTHKKGDS
jgi:hypothetical protein